MKKLITFFTIGICLLSLASCDVEDDSSSESISNSATEWECGTHNGNTLYTGPRGGCYYYNSNGNKTYVDRSECNC